MSMETTSQPYLSSTNKGRGHELRNLVHEILRLLDHRVHLNSEKSSPGLQLKKQSPDPRKPSQTLPICRPLGS